MTIFSPQRCYNVIQRNGKGGEALLQTVYVDVLFVIDFTMDFLALYITSYFLKTRLKMRRIIIAALLGALYSVLTVVLRIDSIILALIFAAFMCFITFGKRSVKGFLHIVISFIAVNFLLGGGMTALFSFFNSVVGERLVMIYGDVSNVPSKLPFNIFAVGVLIIAVLAMTFARFFSKKGTCRRIGAEIELSGKHGSFILTEDSGNLLTESVSGEPVIFLSEKAMLELTDEKTLSAIKNISPEVMGRSRFKMRIAVYQTVSGKEMCLCIRPEKILIGGRAVRAWIACGKADVFGENDGIVPSVLVGE